jgi:flavodoxin I
MANVKVIYGSNTGNTKKAAEMIAAELGGQTINIANAVKEDFDADLLVLGTSTWGMGELQEDWEEHLDIFDKLDLKGAKTAVFGLGDQEGFATTFIDGVGTLHEKLEKAGAEIIGAWDSEEYTHSDSSALKENLFVGLALDDDNEPEKTPERIKKWCSELLSEI